MADDDRSKQEGGRLPESSGPSGVPAAETDSSDAESRETEIPEMLFVPAKSPLRLATIVGLVAVTMFSGLSGLLGYRLLEARKAEEFRHELLEAATRGAVNLTTIDYEHADADVQRILDSSSGEFYDDFKARSGSFTDVVKKVKSKSTGTVTEAGLIPDTVTQRDGQALLAVTIKTTNAGASEEEPRYWRMRLTVTKQGDEAKVSKVEFVA